MLREMPSFAGHHKPGEGWDREAVPQLQGERGIAPVTALTYAEIVEANNAIQMIGDDTYWLCVTRAVRESKLFPWRRTCCSPA